MFTKQKYTLSILVILSIYLINNKTYAKSIYAITSHLGYEVSAYKIDGSELIYQIDEQFPVYDTFGAVGLALDPNSEVLFVSYDANSSKALALINAKTMGLIETKQMDYEFGGLAFDTSYQKLYAVQKLDNLKRVHIYSWDDQTNMLVDDDNVKYLYEVTGTDPYYCIFGIALDDSDGILYVSDGTNKIYMYDTNSNINDPNWSYEGYFEIKAGENEREAVGIDVYNDGQGTRYLYAGSWPHEESHKHLTRTNIDDPNDCIEVLVGESPDTAKDVAGVTVDDETGLIYVTTFHQDIRVYDPNLILLHIEETLVGNPADIVLAGDVQYKPPTIFLDKSDNVDPNGCVSPGDIITYTLVYGPAGLEQQNVWLTDFLPEEVDLLYTDPNYTYYDPSTRTVSWYLGDLDPDDPNTCVYLWVEVNESAPPTGTILNPCEIESDTSYNIAEEMTPVCCWSEILYVDQSTAGYQNGTSWLHAFNELYDALDLAKSGCGTEIRVAEGSYVPRLVQDEYQNWYYEPFQMANGVPVYGGFPTGGGDWDERDPLNNETILGGNGQTEYELPKVVTFESCNENTILDGFIITDSYSNSEDAYGVYIENGSPTVTHNRIMGHEEYGVYIDGGSPLIARNRIDHNDAFGIYIEGTTAAVTHNYIHDNGYGLFADYNSTPHVTNNMIYRNDQTGIYLNNSPSDTILRNNTIAYNQCDGVVKWGGAADPNIVMINCIVWKNDGEQVLYCPAKYSCIYDSVNDPNGVNPDTDENGNITTNPLFYSLEDDLAA